MNKCIVLIASLSLCLVAGCSQKYWYQEGKTFAQCVQDRKICRSELLKRTDLYRLGKYEREFMEDCMQKKGYRLVAEKELPLEVKREDSDIPSELSWTRGYGVAGILE